MNDLDFSMLSPDEAPSTDAPTRASVLGALAALAPGAGSGIVASRLGCTAAAARRTLRELGADHLVRYAPSDQAWSLTPSGSAELDRMAVAEGAGELSADRTSQALAQMAWLHTSLLRLAGELDIAGLELASARLEAAADLISGAVCTIADEYRTI